MLDNAFPQRRLAVRRLQVQLQARPAIPSDRTSRYSESQRLNGRIGRLDARSGLDFAVSRGCLGGLGTAKWVPKPGGRNVGAALGACLDNFVSQ